MRYFITVNGDRLGGTWDSKKMADRALNRVRRARRGEGSKIVLHKEVDDRPGYMQRRGRYGKKYRRKGRRKNSPESLGTAFMISTVSAGIGAALAAAGGQPVTLPRLLAGASAGAGVSVLLGLVGIIFDVETGLETAGIGLGEAILFGAASGISAGSGV